MNVNEKGVSGLIKVIDDLQTKGHYCFTAFDDHSPVDLIVLTKSGNTVRLQIKYRSKSIHKKRVDRYEVSASSVVNGKRMAINRDMIDGWAVYLAEYKKVVYIGVCDMEGKMSITIDPSKEYRDVSELV